MTSILSALGSGKPHSSISDWIEILSGENYTENELDGIPELVDAINLQLLGPSEASRAIRKKLKYGNVHRQLRALTILKALVENGGQKFQKSFADERLTEQLKTLASDPHTDEHVKRKLVGLFGSWQRQFKDDPSMRTAAGLYATVRPSPRLNTSYGHQSTSSMDRATEERAKRAKEKEERKAREREAEEERKRQKQAQKDAQKKQSQGGTRQRKPFNFEEEKPKILNSIANASQSSNNLINALKLVNREKESIETNQRVQETLAEAKSARKLIVRYIQLVENEDLIGTLIDTNERIINALEMYDVLLKSPANDSDDTPPPSTTSSEHPQLNTDWTKSDTASISGQLERLQQKQRAAVERAKSRANQPIHPDLEELTFDDRNALPPPLKPTTPGGDRELQRGSLSDFSDYDSSADEGPRASTSGGRYSYKYGKNQEEDEVGDTQKGLLDEDDPFADPFADQSDVGTPGIPEKGPSKWTIAT